MFKPQQILSACIAMTFTAFSLCVAPAFAIHPDSKNEIENLNARIEALEQQRAGSDLAEDHGPDSGQISKYVTLHGLIEVEAHYADSDAGDTESGVNIANAGLSLEANINEQVGGHIILLYEEFNEVSVFDVDEAVIRLTAPTQLFGQSFSLYAGRMYVPFGMFNSYMVSDPLTLELGETQDTAAVLALEGDVWALKFGSFNGDMDSVGDNNHIDNFVAALELMPIENFAFGVSYINDLADSGSELVQDATLYSSNIAGASAFLSAQCGRFGLELEYLTALDDFDSALIAIGDGLTGKRPEAWNLELAWMPTDKVQLAARYEEAHDFQDEVKRYGATASYGLYEHVVIALEYLRSDADVAVNETVDVATAQLALAF